MLALFSDTQSEILWRIDAIKPCYYLMQKRGNFPSSPYQARLRTHKPEIKQILKQLKADFIKSASLE